MPELFREFEMALYTQLARIKNEGTITDSAPLDGIAQAHNVMITAHPECGSLALDGFARLMRTLIERQRKSGRVTINQFDLATLETGVAEIIAYLPKADVSRMYQASRALRRAA